MVNMYSWLYRCFYQTSPSLQTSLFFALVLYHVTQPVTLLEFSRLYSLYHNCKLVTSGVAIIIIILSSHHVGPGFDPRRRKLNYFFSPTSKNLSLSFIEMICVCIFIIIKPVRVILHLCTSPVLNVIFFH